MKSSHWPSGWVTSAAFVLYSSARCSLSPVFPDRSWGWGWFWPVSPSAACCRTTRAPPPSPGGGLWRCERFPATTACSSPRSCAPGPPWLPGCRGRDTVRFEDPLPPPAPLKTLHVPDGCSPLPLPLVHAYFVVVQGCRWEIEIPGCWRVSEVCRRRRHHGKKSRVTHWLGDR